MDKELILDGLTFINSIRGQEFFSEQQAELTAIYILNSNITQNEFIYAVNNAVATERGWINISHLINPNKVTEGVKVPIVWKKNLYKSTNKEYNYGEDELKLLKNY